MISYKTANPYIKSRFEKTLLRCNKCGSPLVEREGGKFWFLKKQEGKTKKIKVEVSQNSPAGQIRIKCSCGWGIVFAWVNEIIHVKEELTAKRVKV